MAMLIVRAFRSLGYISFGQLVNGSPRLVASCECKLLCFADVVAAAAAIAADVDVAGAAVAVSVSAKIYVILKIYWFTALLLQ